MASVPCTVPLCPIDDTVLFQSILARLATGHVPGLSRDDFLTKMSEISPRATLVALAAVGRLVSSDEYRRIRRFGMDIDGEWLNDRETDLDNPDNWVEELDKYYLEENGAGTIWRRLEWMVRGPTPMIARHADLTSQVLSLVVDNAALSSRVATFFPSLRVLWCTPTLAFHPTVGDLGAWRAKLHHLDMLHMCVNRRRDLRLLCKIPLFSSLTFLRLTCVNVKIPPLGRLSRLESLHIQAYLCEVDMDPLDRPALHVNTLRGLVNLKHLFLSGVEGRPSELSHIAAMTKLESLYLMFYRFGRDHEYVKLPLDVSRWNMPRLERLVLHDIRVGKELLEEVANRFTTLRHLDFEHSGVMPEDVMQVMHLMPRLESVLVDNHRVMPVREMEETDEEESWETA